MSSDDTLDEDLIGDEAEICKLSMTVLTLMRDDEDKLIRQVKRLVKRHIDVAKKVFSFEMDGWTPIHACALRGSKKLLKAMLSSGIDINIKMGQPEGLPCGCTLLHIAANRGDERICDYLVSHGADLNIEDSFGRPPVFYAARTFQNHLVKYFEEKGADLSALETLLPGWSPDVTQECITPQPKTAGFCFFLK